MECLPHVLQCKSTYSVKKSAVRWRDLFPTFTVWKWSLWFQNLFFLVKTSSKFSHAAPQKCLSCIQFSMSKSVGFLQIIPKNKHSILASSPSSPRNDIREFRQDSSSSKSPGFNGFCFRCSLKPIITVLKFKGNQKKVDAFFGSDVPFWLNHVKSIKSCKIHQFLPSKSPWFRSIIQVPAGPGLGVFRFRFGLSHPLPQGLAQVLRLLPQDLRGLTLMT